MPHRSPRGPRLEVPAVARVLVPVLSPAGGGCRSTVSALLGLTFAPLARTAVLDASCPVLSPWSSWATPSADEVAGSGHGMITTGADLDRACLTQRLGSVAWQILCLDGRHAGTAHPAPEELLRLSKLGGWAVTVVDTGHSALRDLAGGPDPVWSTTSAWLEDMPSTPVLAVPNTCQGLDPRPPLRHGRRASGAGLRPTHGGCRRHGTRSGPASGDGGADGPDRPGARHGPPSVRPPDPRAPDAPAGPTGQVDPSRWACSGRGGAGSGRRPAGHRTAGQPPDPNQLRRMDSL